jgi:hypothetical protein
MENGYAEGDVALILPSASLKLENNGTPKNTANAKIQ